MKARNCFNIVSDSSVARTYYSARESNHDRRLCNLCIMLHLNCLVQSFQFFRLQHHICICSLMQRYSRLSDHLIVINLMYVNFFLMLVGFYPSSRNLITSLTNSTFRAVCWDARWWLEFFNPVETLLN